MLRRLPLLCAVFVLVVQATSRAARQTPGLIVVSHTPVGEVTQLADANDVRIMFSEPMVAIGSTAVVGKPSWVTITPAPNGHYFWSGTRTLIFSPDPATPFPYATRYTVHIEGAATSVAGRALGSPYEFAFTTPTVRLLQTMWYRKDGRFDDPAVVMLRFNQPVRSADVLAHAHMHLAPHAWTTPGLQAEARARLEKADPAGLARFDAKVAAVDRVAQSADPVAMRAAEAWDEKRSGFERAPEKVVLETLTAPAPESSLAIEIDEAMPSPAGPATHVAQASQQPLDHAFFIDPFRCIYACNPSVVNSILFRGSVPAGMLARAVTVQDVTRPDAETAVTAANPPPSPDQNAFSLTQAGFDRQPPVSTWMVRIDPTLQTRDGQSLGYPFVGVVQNAHEVPGFGIGGGVWESGSGPKLPLSSRNLLDVTEWAASVAHDEIMPLLTELAQPRFQGRPSPSSRSLPLTIKPDVTEAHGVDVGSVLSAAGTGVVWTAFAPGQVVPFSAGNPVPYRSSIIQVTNLGISVKDSAASTLIFVTRLDTAAPVTDAKVSIVNASNQVLWTGATNGDGVALAPALALRPAGVYRLPPVFIVTAEKDGDLAYVGSDWGTTVAPYQ
ncbi:MAG TPA: Ig-like domain-containing protein, partial [Vicinamibacterales bacterium]